MTKRQIWFYCKWSITTITSIAIIAFNLFLYLLFRIINIGSFNPKLTPQISFPRNKLNYRVDFDRQIKKAHKYTLSLQYYPKIEPTYNLICNTYSFGLKNSEKPAILIVITVTDNQDCVIYQSDSFQRAKYSDVASSSRENCIAFFLFKLEQISSFLNLGSYYVSIYFQNKQNYSDFFPDKTTLEMQT